MRKNIFRGLVITAVGLAMAIGVGAGISLNSQTAKPVYADGTATWAMSLSNKLDTSKKTGTFNDSEGNTWTWTSDQNPGNMQSSNTVQQIGANGSAATVSFSTSDITDNITSVSVECASYQAKHTIAITVGSTTFLSATATPQWTTVGTKTGTGNATGSILISFVPGASARAMYIKSISVVHTSSGGDPDPTSYTVTYNTMGGNEIDNSIVAEGGTIADLPTPTKANDTENKIRYRFDGWYTVDDENNPVFEDGNIFTSSTEVNSDLTLFAKYTEIHYNVVTFSVNGGSSVNNLNVDVGETVTKPNDPHKANYFFDGWFTTENCQQGSEFDFDSTVINSNITLYAKWIDIPIESAGMFVKVTSNEDLVNGGKYLFVYESKAFDGSLASLDAASNTVDVDFDGDNIKRDNNTKTAYFVIDTVNGHIKSASSRYIGRTQYKNGLDDAYTPTSNYQNIINFDQSGNVVVTRQITENESVTLKYNPAAGQNRFRYFTSGQEDIQLYKFVSGHTVTFVTNSDSSIDSIDVLDGETISLPADPTKSPEGGYSYTFEGWYTNIGLTVPFNESAPITNDVTLYAKYTAEAINNPRTYLDNASSIKTVHGSENISLESMTKSIVFSDLNLTNGTQYLDPFNVGGGLTITFAGGSDDGKYYDTGTGIRTYAGGTITITAPGNISSLTLTWSGSNKPNAANVVDNGTYNIETGVWTGSSTSVIFTRPSGSGHWRLQSVSATFIGQVHSVDNVALRFGLSIPESDWESIRDHDGWTINDYGVMLMAEDDMDGYTSIQDAFEKNASSSILIDIHKCQNETPYADPYFDGSDYIFTVKVSFPNDSQYYDDVIYANPYIVVNGTYYFLDDDLYTSVQELADYYHGSSYEYLSDAALNILRA